jgi:hypothetical protein
MEPSNLMYALKFDPALISSVLPIQQDGRIADMTPTLLHCRRRSDETDVDLKEPNLE